MNLFKFFTHNFFFTLFYLLINFQDDSSNIAAAVAVAVAAASNSSSSSSVKFLPGFDGPLPFELETGYIGVGESEDVQIFYYFIKSERNPAKDPLLLWFSGGPGCSSIVGLFYEIGPIQFEETQYYQASLPKLILNPYSWTKVSSTIFIDLPVGVGFSYARNIKAAKSDDMLSSQHAYEFIRKWLVDHPQFISNEVYLGGDSYSGITIPVTTQLISDGNDKGLEPRIEVKGYILGNPGATLDYADYAIPFAHGMGLISNELFESLMETCKEKFHDIDSKNSLCLGNMKNYNELLRDINEEHILEPSCEFVARPRKLLGVTNTMYDKYPSDNQNLEIRKEGSPAKCRSEAYKLSTRWANDENVQEAIHIRKGTIGEWQRCTLDLPYTKLVGSSLPYHANLSRKGFRSIIYSGDHDLVVPFQSTEAWIKSLNYSIVDDWRSWTVNGQVAGYTRTYANRMTFTTLKGAGHIAPEYTPSECRAMFERWISYQPL